MPLRSPCFFETIRTKLHIGTFVINDFLFLDSFAANQTAVAFTPGNGSQSVEAVNPRYFIYYLLILHNYARFALAYNNRFSSARLFCVSSTAACSSINPIHRRLTFEKGQSAKSLLNPLRLLEKSKGVGIVFDYFALPSVFATDFPPALSQTSGGDESSQRFGTGSRRRSAEKPRAGKAIVVSRSAN